MSSDREDMIIKAIDQLRTDINYRLDNEIIHRMDTQDTKRGEQWKVINELQVHVCPKEQHVDIESRVKVLELDKAKRTGIILTASLVASVVVWGIERMLR